MACTLAESLNDPFHRKLRQLRCLRCRFDCYRVERTSSRAGVSPAEVQRLSRRTSARSEEHTSELQSRLHLVCRLLLEKKKEHTTAPTPSPHPPPPNPRPPARFPR